MFQLKKFTNVFVWAGLCFIGLLCVGCDVGNSSDSYADKSINDSNNDNSVDNSTGGGKDDDNVDDESCLGKLNGVDGPGGFTWKPESDSTGSLVIFFPSDYTEPFESVMVTQLFGSPEFGIFDGFNADDAFGERQIWRFNFPGSAYIGLIRVTIGSADSAGGGVCLWNVDNVSEVQD